MTTLSFDSLVDSKPIKIDLDGTPVCVTKIGEEVFAIADTCSHSDASLSAGEVSNFKIECWLHGSGFDVRTGIPTSLPAITAVKTYPVTTDITDPNSPILITKGTIQ